MPGIGAAGYPRGYDSCIRTDTPSITLNAVPKKKAAIALGLQEALRAHGSLPLALLAGGPRGAFRERLLRLAHEDPGIRKRRFYEGSAHPVFLPCSPAGPALLFDAAAWWDHEMTMTSVEHGLSTLIDVCRRASLLLLRKDDAESTAWLTTLAKVCGVERTATVPDDATWEDIVPLFKVAARPAPSGPLCTASLQTTWYGLTSGTWSIRTGMPPHGAKAGDTVEVYEGAQVRPAVVREVASDRLVVSASISKADDVLGIAAAGSALVAQQAHATWLGGAKPERGELFSLGRRWGPCEVSFRGGRWSLSCPRMFLARRSGLVALLKEDWGKPLSVSFLKLP